MVADALPREKAFPGRTQQGDEHVASYVSAHGRTSLKAETDNARTNRSCEQHTEY
jgi:hypothetical protein